MHARCFAFPRSSHRASRSTFLQAACEAAKKRCAHVCCSNRIREWNTARWRPAHNSVSPGAICCSLPTRQTAPNTFFCQSSHTCPYRKVFERTFRSPSPPPQNRNAVLRIAPFRPRRPRPENFSFPTNIPSVSQIALTCLAFSSLPGRDPPQAAAKFLIAPL